MVRGIAVPPPLQMESLLCGKFWDKFRVNGGKIRAKCCHVMLFYWIIFFMNYYFFLIQVYRIIVYPILPYYRKCLASFDEARTQRSGEFGIFG